MDQSYPLGINDYFIKYQQSNFVDETGKQMSDLDDRRGRAGEPRFPASLDLSCNKYDRKTLKDNIYALSQIDILRTQHLDITFIVRYVLNERYNLNNDKKITIENVLQYQPHIKLGDLLQEMNSYDSDDDSVADFESLTLK